MAAPHREIAGCAASHGRLLEALAGLGDEVARRPSLLPGWTVGHVLAHVARNADSVVRRLEAAARGEVVEQYAGGPEGRAAEIEAGAGRPADELVADVQVTAKAVEAAFARMPEDAWGHITRTVSGSEIPARDLARSRWREVELHHVDLGLGYVPADWPADLVAADLPVALGTLAPRTDPAALLAWAVGRGPAPELSPWP
jgi:maleylpyruvate isomerase